MLDKERDQFLTAREVCQMLRIMRITRAGLFGLVKRGILPQPYKLGRILRWNKAEVKAALNALAPQRAQQTPMPEAPDEGEADDNTETKRQRKRGDA
jgi:predicted DNA-binding transcriptional regulator AlpA